VDFALLRSRTSDPNDESKVTKLALSKLNSKTIAARVAVLLCVVLVIAVTALKRAIIQPTIVQPNKALRTAIAPAF